MDLVNGCTNRSLAAEASVLVASVSDEPLAALALSLAHSWGSSQMQLESAMVPLWDRCWGPCLWSWVH